MADSTPITAPENILESVKLMLGIQNDYTAFDQQILLHTNSVFVILNQLGVGPSNIFTADSSNVWSDFLVNDSIDLNLVKSYVYLKVRLLFDPPTSSFAIEAMNKQAQEYEWRLNVFVDPPSGEEDNAG